MGAAACSLFSLAPPTPAVPVVLVCPARPRHRLRALQLGSPVPPAPLTPAVPVVLVCPAKPRRRLRALQPGPPVPPERWQRGTTSGLECRLEARLGPDAAYGRSDGFR